MPRRMRRSRGLRRSDTSRRLGMIVLVLGGLVTLSGCALLLGSQTYSAAPASACDEGLSATDYDTDFSEWENVTRDVDVLGQTRSVTVSNYWNGYVRERPTEDGDVESKGGVVIVASPAVDAFGQSLNPVGEWTARQMVDELAESLDTYGTLSDITEERSERVEVLGTETTTTRFSATGEGGQDGTVEVFVEVLRVEHAGDFVVMGSIYEQANTAERTRLDRLRSCIDHAGTSPTDTGTAFDSTTSGSSGPGTVTFASSSKVIQEHLGDVARIPLLFSNTDTATLTIGNEDLNWKARLSVHDDDGDGEATLRLNTDNVRQDGTVFSASDGDSVSDVQRLIGGQFSDPNRRIAATPYPMSISTGGPETDVATLALQDPADIQRSLSLSRARSALPVRDAIANRSESSSVAEHDWLVLTVRSAGIFGYLGDDPSAALSGNGTQGVTLSITETDVGGSESPDTVSANAFSPVVDADSNQVFLAAKVTEDTGLEIGSTYRVKFKIAASNPYVDEPVNRSGTIAVGPRTLSIDTFDGQVHVQQAPDRPIEGSSSVAAGTPLTVTIQSSGENVPDGQPFLWTRNVTTDDKGEWLTSFDFESIPQGQSFTVRVTERYTTASAPGIVTRPASVSLSSQLSETGSVVVIDSAYLPTGGYVTIHDQTLLSGSAVESVRGTSKYLTAGQHSNIRVVLDEPFGSTHEVIAMAHTDDGDAIFEFVTSNGESDGPYTLGGSAVTDSASVQVPTPTTTEPGAVGTPPTTVPLATR